MREVSTTALGRASDQSAMRRQNLSLTLRMLRATGPQSRAKLAETTALNKATVSSLVTELSERGLVADGEVDRGEVGRPAQTVALSGSDVCGIGAEIGNYSITVVAIDLERSPLVVVGSTAVSPDAVDAAARALAELVREVFVTLGQRTVAGMRLGLPVPVDTKKRRVRRLPGHPLGDVPIATMVAELVSDLGLDVQVDNEANLAAIAEASLRPGVDDLVVLTGSVGVGAGIVVGGEVLRGFSGFGGEAGHMPVELQGGLCACERRGCWETRVGMDALVRGVAEIGDPILSPEFTPAARLTEIVHRAEASDQRTLDALEQVGRWLGVGASTLANVLDPEVFVLGGYFASVAPWLVSPMNAELERRALGAGESGYRIEASQLSTGAAAHGAAVAALEPVFDDPTMVPRKLVNKVGA